MKLSARGQHIIRGGAGHNLPLDLINEFVNQDFKENMKRCHGRYTAKHARRTSKLTGSGFVSDPTINIPDKLKGGRKQFNSVCFLCILCIQI